MFLDYFLLYGFSLWGSLPFPLRNVQTFNISSHQTWLIVDHLCVVSIPEEKDLLNVIFGLDWLQNLLENRIYFDLITYHLAYRTIPSWIH